MDESTKDVSQLSQENPENTPQADSEALQECQAQVKQLQEKYLYLNAEFDNYKKRLEKERTAWVENAQDGVLLNVLPIMDDMERALAELHSGQLPAEVVAHLAGMELIAKGLSKMLKRYDVEEIPPAKTFDPQFFEAVMQVESEAHASGEIVSNLEKGYTRKGRVLRPAKVSIAQ